MKKFLVLLTVIATGIAVATAWGASRPSAYILPGDAVYPEGIAYDQKTGSFFVSSTTDGTIFRGTLKRAQTSVFLPGGTDGRTTAIGLEADRFNRLVIAGGPTGNIFVYSIRTKRLLGKFSTGSGGFLNDVAVTKRGDIYVTDSFRPTLWRVRAGTQTAEAWLNFAGTPITYGAGFNLNGIVATPDGKYLIVTQSNTGKLYRIEIATKKITEINLGGQLVNGDGLELVGRTLYAVAGGQIVKLRLSGDLTRGTVLSRTSNASFKSPTTNAIAKGRMLVVNSQFAARSSGTPPSLPFTVSSIKIP